MYTGSFYSKVVRYLAKHGESVNPSTSWVKVAKKVGKVNRKPFTGVSKEEAMIFVANLLNDQQVQVPRKSLYVDSADFYSSDAWRRLRYRVLLMHGRECMCCGAKAGQGVVLHVDHIKPRVTHPHLQLDITNLQILCEDCNLGKGARDETDFR